MFRFYTKVAKKVYTGLTEYNKNKNVNMINSMFGPCKTPTKVGFFDIDVNIHMNNAKFLEAMELGRWDFCARNGMLKVWYGNIRNKANVGALFPVIASCNLKFLKQLKYNEKYYIKTSITAVDDKYAYFEQQLYKTKSNKCAAKMFGKTALLGRTEPYSSNFVVIPPSDVFQDMIDKKIFSFNDEDNDNNNNSNPITINDLAKFMPPVDNDLLEWIKLDRPKSIVICNRNDDE
jgi:acyl-CoA thioesterase FadM|tara:strand:- start:18 stop:716 length:699 start_codon:yes stop_codon:yes gene_type:complete